ncbi:hypothetical protein Cantr_06754 [Candida viswanathii]|uniref:Uncharacterized protein n=1 Tax=Candida viswanathii TaxID=5486 RepID=A0A367XV49_9ASCO|nr:hypothetical protein Cantr_06754 [Candida viswanathii]
MGWFSFSSFGFGSGSGADKSKPSDPPMPPQQVEQRSHHALNLPQNSDIATTLNQLSSQTDDNKDVKVLELNTTQVRLSIDEFVDSYPASNMFVIDGEKDSKDSIICTNNRDGGKTCLKLKLNSIELYKIMQKKRYICLLPNDINATYFECRKIDR